MYLFKAKKNLDARDFEDYRRRLVDRDDKSYVHITGSRAGGALDEPSQSQPGPTADGQTLGMAAAGAALSQAPSSTFDTVTVACPWLQVKRGVESETTTTRPVEYMGSFSASGDDQHARAEQVRRQLLQMRNVTKLKPVLLIISLSGVRVSSRAGDSVYMAHALKRISYAACDPEYQQFSFLAREPKGRTDVQYCHAFRTETSQEAEELNAILGNAFRMAFSLESEGPTKIPPVPSFNELIEQQIVEQKILHQRQLESERRNFEKRLSQISTPRVAERSAELKELRQKQAEEAEAEAERERMAGRERKTWAKQLVNKAKHWSPIGSNEGSLDHGTPGGATDNGGARDSVNQNNSRPYGSPVVTLKEKIDSHYSSGHTNGGSCSCHLDSFLQHTTLTPTSAFSAASRSNTGQDRNNSSNSNGVVKRTPPMRTKAAATSSPDYQNQSGHSSVTPDLVDGHALTDNLCRPEIVRLRKQNSQFTGRPVSTRYQNSSPPRALDQQQQPQQQQQQQQQQGDGSPGPTGPNEGDEQLKKSDPAVDTTRDQLKHAPWFQAGIARELALEKLSQEGIGAFIVRSSTTHPGCFALSVKVPKFDNPTGISHYLITRTPSAGFKVKGLEKEWQTLTALVTHHTVMQEMLPCTLRLPRNSRNPSFRDSDRDEEEEDYRKVCSSTGKNLPDLQA